MLCLVVAVPTVLAADRAVAIRDFAFSPRSITIRVGDTVTWTNHDSVAHSATARGGTFDTGLIDEGESRSVRFTIGGTYRFVCTPHPDMTGTIVVRAASSGVQPPNTDTASTGGVGTNTLDLGGIGGAAAIGGVAFWFAHRSIRRRPMA